MRFFRQCLRRLLVSFIRRHPSLARDALKDGNHSFGNLPNRPQRNFEDLDWMLESNLTNKGLLLLEFDEAAFLFRLARSKPAAQIIEIGRYHGGSAFLFAVASDGDSVVTSIDIAPQNAANLVWVRWPCFNAPKRPGPSAKVRKTAFDLKPLLL